MTFPRSPPEGWLPSNATWRNGELRLEWSSFGKRRLEGPFFDNDVQRCRHAGGQVGALSTSLRELPEWLEADPGLQPSGFIFHMSRCGSTLVSRMLAAVPRNVVISEAGPIDAVVRARLVRPDLTDDRHADWLTWIIGAFSRPRRGNERHVVIKLDSWHTLQLPVFRRAFPTVPWVFLYRDPVEVIVSQLRRRGMHLIPGLGIDLCGIAPVDAAPLSEDFCARGLASICEPVTREYAGGGAMLINYRQLPAAAWALIAAHFGIGCDEPDRDAMAAAALFDAKSPAFPFTPDAEAKQRAASDRVRSAAVEQLGGIYHRLETLRQRGQAGRMRQDTSAPGPQP
jgi:gluconate kinase